MVQNPKTVASCGTVFTALAVVGGPCSVVSVCVGFNSEEKNESDSIDR